MHLVLISAVIAALPVAPPAAKPQPVRIVVLPPPSVADTAGFITALRIQLGQSATVTAGPMVEGDTSAARASFALARAGELSATMSVWRELRTTATAQRHDYVLNVVTTDAGAMRHRTFPLTSARPGPDTDRALALKIATLIDSDRSARRSQTPPAGANPTPPVTPHRPPWRPWLGGGGSGGVGNGTPSAQFGVDIRGGVMRGDRRQTALYIAGHLDRGVNAVGDAGELSTRELHADVGATVLRRLGDHAMVGADLRLGSRMVRARGVTTAGTDGTTWVFVPRAVACVVGGWQLTPRLGLRGEVGAEVVSRRRRFAVNNEVLVDLGRVRMHMGLLLVFPVR